MSPRADIRLGVVRPIPSAVLQQSQRQRTQNVRRWRYDAAQRLGVEHPLVPVIARAGILPGWLILQLRPLELLAVELIPRHRRHLRSNDGRVPLSGCRDEELHRVLVRKYERALDPVDAYHRLGRERPSRALRADLGIPEETVRVRAHAEDVSGLVNCYVDVVLRDALGHLPALVEVDLIQAEIDRAGGRTIELSWTETRDAPCGGRTEEKKK